MSSFPRFAALTISEQEEEERRARQRESYRRGDELEDRKDDRVDEVLDRAGEYLETYLDRTDNRLENLLDRFESTLVTCVNILAESYNRNTVIAEENNRLLKELLDRK